MYMRCRKEDVRCEKVFIIFAENPLNTPANPSLLTILNNICNISHLFNLLINLACKLPPLTSEAVLAGRSSLGRACNLVFTVSRGYTALTIRLWERGRRGLTRLRRLTRTLLKEPIRRVLDLGMPLLCMIEWEGSEIEYWVCAFFGY